MKKSNILFSICASLLLAGGAISGLSAEDFKTAKGDGSTISYVEYDTTSKEFVTKTINSSLMSPIPTSTFGGINEVDDAYYYFGADTTFTDFCTIKGYVYFFIEDGVTVNFTKPIYSYNTAWLTIYGGVEGTGTIIFDNSASTYSDYPAIFLRNDFNAHKVNVKAVGGKGSSSDYYTDTGISAYDVNLYGTHVEASPGPSTAERFCGYCIFANNTVNINAGAELIANRDNIGEDTLNHPDGVDSLYSINANGGISLNNGKLTYIAYRDYSAYHIQQISDYYKLINIAGQLDKVMIGDDLEHLTQFNDADHYCEDNEDIEDYTRDADIKLNMNKVVSFECSDLIPATGIDMGDFEDLPLEFKTSVTDPKIIDSIHVLPENASRKKLDWTSSDDYKVQAERYEKIKGKISLAPGATYFDDATITVTTRDGTNISKTFDVDFIQSYTHNVIFLCGEGQFVGSTESSITLETDDNGYLDVDTIPECTREGWIFKGWKDLNNNLISDFSTHSFSTDTVLNAHYIQKVTNIALSLSSDEIKVGDTFMVMTECTPNSFDVAFSLNFESLDTSIVEFEAIDSPIATAKKEGTVTIKVTDTIGGATATLNITVLKSNNPNPGPGGDPEDDPINPDNNKVLSGGARFGIVFGSSFFVIFGVLIALYILWKKKDFNLPIVDIILTPVFRFVNNLIFKTKFNDVELKNQ